MAYPNWTFVLSTLGGVKIGEVLDASDRQVVRSLSQPSTAQFKILATNRLLGDVFNRDLNLQCYRNGTLVFHGPVLTAQLAADDPTATPSVVVTAADPSWRFDRRVAGKSATGTDFVATTDRLQVAQSLIGTANSESPTGVRTLGLNCGTTLTGTYKAGPYKKLSECINEMGNTYAGFDWRIDPIEYTTTYIGEFNAAAILGQQRPGAVLEYSGKANARNPNFIKGIETTINQAWSVPDGGPTDVGGVLTSSDSASISARNVLEEVIDTSGLVNVGLRQAVVNDHILYRSKPRQVLTLNPDFDDGTGRTPAPFSAYTIGDYIRGRILYNNVSLVDGFVRVYKLQFDIDANEKETVTPTVVNESA